MPDPFTVHALAPAPDAFDVAPAVPLFVAFTSVPADLVAWQVAVGGEPAFDGAAFNRPAFDGVHQRLPSGYQALAFDRRRDFNPGQVVSVVLTLVIDPGAVVYTRSHVFYVAPRPPPPVDDALRAARIERPLPLPGLELLRQRLAEVLRFVLGTSLFHFVKISQLRAFIPSFGLPPSVTRAERGLRPVALESVVAVLDAVAPVWPLALRELAGLGEDAPTIAVLQQAFVGDFPQERVAAVATGLLRGARRLELAGR